MRKVCIYSNIGHFIELYEIQLEIAQRHLDNGDSVEFLFCDGLIPICEINLNKEIDICLHCISRRNQGLKLLKGKYKKRLSSGAQGRISDPINIPVKNSKNIRVGEPTKEESSYLESNSSMRSE